MAELPKGVDKLSNGTYRIRKMYKGKTYTVYSDVKPSKSLAERLIMDEVGKNTSICSKDANMTFQQACDEYINIKSNVLSPSTVSDYKNMVHRYSEGLLDTKLKNIIQAQIQAEINMLAAVKSGKTVRNMHGFISTVIKMFNPTMVINTTLPTKQIKEVYIPNVNDVKQVLAYVKGTKYEVPIRLALYSMRRSEICALTINDLDGNVITINKAKVYSKDNHAYVIKPYGKTIASNRQIVIDDYLANLIKKQGYVYKGQIADISKFLKKVEKELGLDEFSPHKFRHFFASEMSGIIPEADLLKMGGWQTDMVMKTVYRHSMNTKNLEAQRVVSNQLEVLFSDKSLTN